MNKPFKIILVVLGVLALGFLIKTALGFIYLNEKDKALTEKTKKCEEMGMSVDEFGNCVAHELSWEQMVAKIQTGQYKGISQDHSKMLKLTATDGKVYQAMQPDIDDYLKVLETCEKCPKIPIATE